MYCLEAPILQRNYYYGTWLKGDKIIELFEEFLLYVVDQLETSNANSMAIKMFKF